MAAVQLKMLCTTATDNIYVIPIRRGICVLSDMITYNRHKELFKAAHSSKTRATLYHSSMLTP